MTPFVLIQHVAQALAQVGYCKLEDGTIRGRIPPSKGVVAFGLTFRECEEELHSTLEAWTLVSLKLGHPLRVIASNDLNKMPGYEPVGGV